jgi:hypothetical protein
LALFDSLIPDLEKNVWQKAGEHTPECFAFLIQYNERKEMETFFIHQYDQ